MGRQIAVIGSGAEHETRAEEVGRLLAERGCTVVTGGLGEVMAAACRGAKAAGGTTIAIVPGASRAKRPTNGRTTWWRQASGMPGTWPSWRSGDAVIAVGGQWGTLAEIGSPACSPAGSSSSDPGWALDGDGIEHAATPAEGRGSCSQTLDIFLTGRKLRCDRACPTGRANSREGSR
jgi:uncharacterized protein (TIGR00725 family)